MFAIMMMLSDLQKEEDGYPTAKAEHGCLMKSEVLGKHEVEREPERMKLLTTCELNGVGL
jgi:hypothetical protein